MGRKIPARKHHGIRDPIKQNELRLAKIKDKINAPPTKDQHISHKLAQFIKLKDDVKKGKFKKFKRTIENEDKPKTKKNISNKIKPIRQYPNETDEDYLKRVNRITTQSLKESQYELKYGVNVVRNSQTGEIVVEKREKNEIDELLESKKKKKKIPKKTSKIDEKTAKELVKQLLKEEREKKKTEELKEYKVDVVKFGEVVHTPPTLTVPRKAQKSETVPRPGNRNNLLLKGLLENNSTKKEATEKVENSKQKTLPAVVDLKGKRKDLPASTRRMIEDQQNRAIEMYRKIKKSKMQ